MKNVNQGVEGVEVDDLLQLSYLQRLARQKVAEMEVSFSPGTAYAYVLPVHNLLSMQPCWSHTTSYTWLLLMSKELLQLQGMHEV